METNKNKPITLFLGIAAIGIIFLSAVIFYKKPTPPYIQDKSQVAGKLDKLFYNMGVQQMPSVLPPMDILLNDVNGNRLKISDLKGNIVFLNFWATWCPGCKMEMPSMEKLHHRFKDKEFVMVAVSLQEPVERVRQFLTQNKLSFTTLLDLTGDVGSRFGAFSIPTTYILDRDGSVIGRAVGARDWYCQTAISLFEHLIQTGNMPL